MPRKPRRGSSGVQIGEAQARGMVLQGGAIVFAAKGARAASVEDILEAGRISRRTFYRLFSGKDDVMLALYRMGTDHLYEVCRRAISAERDPVRRLEHFVNAHLANARGFGRLIFVLGGEATHPDSPLFARRIEVHQQLIALLADSVPDVDPLLLRGLILALEGVTRLMLEECDHGRSVTEAAITRVRAVMLRIATAAVLGAGPGVTPLPPAPRP